MNTFFYTMLEDMTRKEYSYTKLARILSRKKLNLHDYSLILIPINITSSHWLFAALDFAHLKLTVVDSMGCRPTQLEAYYSNLKRFLSDYLQTTKPEQVMCDWTLEVAANTPR